MAHYLLTGHTGFKGSWLISLLSELGHVVSGIGLDPDLSGLYRRLNLSSRLVKDVRADIRDRDNLVATFADIKPDFVVHFAAQSLVSIGWEKPHLTYEVNVGGTLNVINAAELTDSIKAQLVVTTDKVYRQGSEKKAHREGDALGGSDPYSASKAAADLLAQERLRATSSKPGVIARGGNVIGLGDQSRNRLVPDVVRAIRANDTLLVRQPNSIRPWQHVLDCLNGYLTLLENIATIENGSSWNVGPSSTSLRSVSDVLEVASRLTDLHFRTSTTSHESFAEAPYLALDSNKIRRDLGWRDFLGFEESIEWALADVVSGREVELAELVTRQIQEFLRRKSS